MIFEGQIHYDYTTNILPHSPFWSKVLLSKSQTHLLCEVGCLIVLLHVRILSAQISSYHHAPFATFTLLMISLCCTKPAAKLASSFVQCYEGKHQHFFNPLTLKRAGGGWNQPAALSKARHFACDEVMSV